MAATLPFDEAIAIAIHSRPPHRRTPGGRSALPPFPQPVLKTHRSCVSQAAGRTYDDVDGFKNSAEMQPRRVFFVRLGHWGGPPMTGVGGGR
jgi:hypothetical protein